MTVQRTTTPSRPNGFWQQPSCTHMLEAPHHPNVMKCFGVKVLIVSRKRLLWKSLSLTRQKHPTRQWWCEHKSGVVSHLQCSRFAVCFSCSCGSVLENNTFLQLTTLGMTRHRDAPACGCDTLLLFHSSFSVSIVHIVSS